MSTELEQKIERLQGPILVLGASGFVGANLMRQLLAVRGDVFGTASRLPAWRLEDLPRENIIVGDLLVESSVGHLLDRVRPLTVFNCVAYGAYSFERDSDRIYRTNVELTARLLEELDGRELRTYVHAGSSSEYGLNSAAPGEGDSLLPNSHYAVSKAAVSQLIRHLGQERGLPCVHLRLYSVYGPYEDASRLIPTLIAETAEGRLPPFAEPRISRDFVYVDDVGEAFVDVALGLRPAHYGASFNIGAGKCTTLGEVARLAREIFEIEAEPEFNFPKRDWDVADWYADPSRAAEVFGWRARTDFAEGLRRTAEWYGALSDPEAYRRASKQFGLDTRDSVSAIIACYRDGQAIPVMYERLTRVFTELAIDYEIIFVNDGSPDDSEAVIQEISRRDHRVIGITHSRNFGSQAAFRSGLRLSTKNACVLLDGDLQDPPELIPEFVERWREGYEVVYGRRVDRDAPLHMRVAYKLFYRLFHRFSYLSIPRDAGDFSLLDRRVVSGMLRFPERDLFLRGIRAFVGFRQVGVDYKRPERMFGVSTNNLLRNIGWAKKGILSFSNVPLNVLSALGFLAVVVSVLLAILQILAKLLFPELVPPGVTTLLLTVAVFGSLNLFALSLVGEYVAKIFEEVKHRPHFLRRHIVRDGEVREAPEPMVFEEGGSS